MGRTIIVGNFEWDEEKSQANERKHGFGFEEVLDMFEDPFLLETFDVKHSTPEEERFLALGMTHGVLVVITCFTERSGRTRIISSRRALKEEKEIYYERQKHIYD